MKFRHYGFTIAAVITCLTSLHAFGQSEKIPLRRLPQPNQTIRMKMVQEMDMAITIEGLPAATGAAAPISVSTKTVTTMTQKTGALDSQGQMESEITVDEATSETKTSIPGQTPPASVTNPMVGKKFTVVLDQQGNIVDSKFPDVPGLPADLFNQLMKNLYANLPTTPIGIGETATAPLDYTIPLPLPGAAPLKMNGEVKYKLLSIDKQGGDRIATIDSTIDGKLVSDLEVQSPAGNIKMNIDFKIDGGGTALSNLDKGFMKSSESNSNLGGAIHMGGGGNLPQLPNMNLRGTIKMTIASEN